jgi:hypothetical protein
MASPLNESKICPIELQNSQKEYLYLVVTLPDQAGLSGQKEIAIPPNSKIEYLLTFTPGN